MTADLLRRAAKLMRERADAALSGPWVTDGAEIHEMETGERLWVGETLDIEDREQGEWNAQHIASWHPAVALAVADWLDYVAENPMFVGQIPKYSTFAQAVARAYLGESS